MACRLLNCRSLWQNNYGEKFEVATPHEIFSVTKNNKKNEEEI